MQEPAMTIPATRADFHDPATQPATTQPWTPDPKRGFLPAEDPLTALPAALSPWEQLAAQLPKFLVTEHLSPTLDKLPPLDISPLMDFQQRDRAMLLLSYLAHAYVWADTPFMNYLKKHLEETESPLIR
jgi:hypothetical protein